ncbi:MAG: sensor histidine kinase [Clostridiales bacterium]|nr:sensor histidine kinase [Clostridiales bacterium]
MLHSIRSKVLLAILAVTVLTACSITVVFYYRSADMIEENYTRNLYGRVEQTVTSLDDSLKEIYYVNIHAACDEKLISLAEDYSKKENAEKLDEISDLLRQYGRSSRDLASLYFIFPEKKLAVTSEDYPVCKKNLEKEDLEEIEKLQEGEAAPVIMENPVHEGEKQLSCVQEVTDGENRRLGYLVANTQERNLFYEYLQPVEDDKISKVLILDKNGRIVTGGDDEQAGEVFGETSSFTENGGIRHSGNGEEISMFYEGAFSGCGMYLSVPRSEVLRDLRMMKRFLGMIFGGFLVLAVGMALWLTRALYRPIRNLTDTVEKVSKGDLSLRVEVSAGDEIGILSREFNTMLDHIENLIEKVIEEEQMKKDAELEALQYQITPHFMYNTLNSIKYAALLKGEKELGGLIGDFVELLQTCISKKGTFITVADELHMLENYIHLQKFRYQGGFEVVYRIQEEAYGLFVPRLILQPLVENALLHGIDIKERTGKLVISGKVRGSSLILSVEDNGRGMSKEQIQQLFSEKKKKTNGLSAIGIPNIRERLRLYYGDDGGITYESDENGTTATIFLPAEVERDGR